MSDENRPKAVEDLTPVVPKIHCEHCGADYAHDEAHVCPPEAHLWDQAVQGCPVCSAVSAQDGEPRACPVNQPKAFMAQTGMDQSRFDEYMAAWHRDSKDPNHDRPKARIKTLWAPNRGVMTVFCSCGMKAQVGPFPGHPRSPEYGQRIGDALQATIEEHVKACRGLGRGSAYEVRRGSLDS
jgi:hypothetical protein